MQRRMVRRPEIIAMKGHPCTGKSTLASSIAQARKCLLIDQDDVRDSIASLLQSLPTTTTEEYLDDQSYEAICRIALPQLRLGFNLIIDSPLSRRAHLDRLQQLSTSTGANLIIVECKPQDKYEWRQWLERRGESNNSTVNCWYKPSKWEDFKQHLQQDGGGYSSDYDIRDVSKIVVNTTELVTVSDLLLVVERLAASTEIHCIDYHDWMGKLAKGLIEDGGVSERKGKQLEHDEDEGTHYVHYHALLAFSEEQSNNDDQVICRGCLEPISDTPKYKCNQCQLSLHRSCAELPSKREIKPQDYPLFLGGIPGGEFCFREIVKCNYCGSHDDKDFNECPECLFEAYIRSAELPSVLRHHPCHEHPLCVMIVPISFRSEFRCKACGNLGKHIRYYCYDCGFQCHLSCGLLPHTFKHERHRHPLTLTFLPDQDADSLEEEEEEEEFFCNACEKNRNPKHWMYYCADCEFASHLSCMTFGG